MLKHEFIACHMPFLSSNFYGCMLEIDLKWYIVHKLNSAKMIRIMLFLTVTALIFHF